LDSAELLHRWESLLDKAPRLRPWLEQELGRHRLLLEERVSHSQIEEMLWEELAHWLTQFEALPQFAVCAIATTLEEDGREGVAVRRTVQAGGGEQDAPEADSLDSLVGSPERAVSEMEMLLSDPAFALAFHCVEVRLRPRLAAALEDAPALSRVPEAAWFGLLHASAPSNPLLTAEVAVTLLLRVSSADWSRLPARARKAALRLFQASSSDVRGHRGEEALRKLCDSLPLEWHVLPASLPDFVAVSRRARVALADASALCNRIASSVTCGGRGPPRGGLALLRGNDAPPATPEELGNVAETARKYARIAGFRRLLALF
jgi:hypothetical protein